MAERKQETFTVTDRRLFTADGELRKDTPEEREEERPVTTKPQAATAPTPSHNEEPQGPSAAESGAV